MKYIHQASQFIFKGSDGDVYSVEVPAAKRGENIFRLRRNGTFIGEHQPTGCNVSRSTALEMLKIILKSIGE